MGRQPKSRVDEKGRVCLTCTQYKKWPEFHRGKGANGYVPHCKPCISDMYADSKLPLPPCYWCKLVLEDRYIWAHTRDKQVLCSRDCEQAYKRHVEILDQMAEQLPQFKIGDTVRIVGVSSARPELRGLETGTITKTSDVLGLEWTVTFPDNEQINYAERELKLVAGEPEE